MGGGWAGSISGAGLFLAHQNPRGLQTGHPSTTRRAGGGWGGIERGGRLAISGLPASHGARWHSRSARGPHWLLFMDRGDPGARQNRPGIQSKRGRGGECHLGPYPRTRTKLSARTSCMRAKDRDLNHTREGSITGSRAQHASHPPPARSHEEDIKIPALHTLSTPLSFRRSTCSGGMPVTARAFVPPPLHTLSTPLSFRRLTCSGGMTVTARVLWRWTNLAC